MPELGNKHVLAVLEDLLFTVKISDAAKRSGATAKFCKTEETTLAAAAAGPSLILIDLNYHSINPLSLIRNLKRSSFAGIPLMGFVSHVQTELKQSAHDAGCDIVLARSTFSQNLPQLLKRYLEPAS